MMRGDAPRIVSAAKVIDPEGKTQFHIITTWWSRAIIVAFATLITVILILAGLIFINKTQIEDLRQQIQVVNDNNANTSNSNRR